MTARIADLVFVVPDESVLASKVADMSFDVYIHVTFGPWMSLFAEQARSGRRIVIDPRCEAVLIADRNTGQFADRTRDVASYQTVGDKIDIVFNGDPRVFSHRWARVRILRNLARVSLRPGARVEVRGAIWEYATELWAFTGPVGAWWRIFSRRQEGEEVYYTYPASQVRVVMSAAQAPGAAEVLSYWRDIMSRLSDDDPLRGAYAR
jgi:hypothetical protein